MVPAAWLLWPPAADLLLLFALPPELRRDLKAAERVVPAIP